ncbi:hypothetical protein Q9295_05080 [Xinfangfangia sp. CPCC 101601]|uniref:Uncharacterized protein n=1 Tax=Pseudogemmobacter lacusdianii TaxID=3069608 RepID=A0ABU0VVH0_9RHOB|nr:hypothetical protein [Xinfangfangia sp. CPCC 101601]MDQ2065734.1 hypothetical protein [Xinfangfangia sp. CPCC 101601]
MRALLLTLALLPSAALADCGADTEIFSCQIGKKQLQICFDDRADVFAYTFGRKGKPDLSLWETTPDLDFQPWPGVGSAIWENVTFYNDGHSYEVWTSVQRDPEDQSGLSAGVTVRQGETTLTTLTCNPGSASQSLDVIYDVKVAYGQCWSFADQAWAWSCD